MRIGIDARFLGGPSYGLSQYSESLLRALSRRDEKNTYTVFVGPNLKRRLEVGPNFELVPVRGRPLSFKGIARLRLALRHRTLDLFHVHFPLAPVGANYPTVITVHDVVPFAHSQDHGMRFPVWDRIGGWFLYPATMRRAKWIVCVSRATRDRLVELFPEAFHKTIILRSGVEDEYESMKGRLDSELIRSRLDAGGKYVFYSGSSGESKNIPRMIETFALLQRREPRAREYSFILDLTGDLGGLRAIRDVIGRYSLDRSVRIMTHLTIEERLVLFREASLLFMASKDEGFGVPILRSQLAGVPVVAADSGALPEICGEAGLLVDPDNLEQMVEMIEGALFDNDLREFLIGKGRTNVRRFSWDETAEDIRQIYELLF